jgi:hypothetical protein
VAVAALIIGIIGVVVSLIPLIPVTQIVGTLLGLIAIVLGLLSRQEGKEKSKATAGVVLGAASILLSVAIFGSCVYCVKKVENNAGILGEEFKEKLSSPEFQQAMEKARKALEKTQKELKR